MARLIVGLEAPTAGRIVLGDRDVTRASAADARHRLHWAQMVFQDPQSALNPRRRVASIVTQALEAAAADRWDARLAHAARALNCWPRSACRPTLRRAIRRSFPAASASASTSRARSAPCRAC